MLLIAFESNQNFVTSVGRKSSVLKMKPTPPPSEITSLKRHRSAPRTSTSKRKVLMDDTMVLHGEYVVFLYYMPVDFPDMIAV